MERELDRAPSRPLTRRRFLRTLALGAGTAALGAGAACTAAPPSPTAAPSKPTAETKAADPKPAETKPVEVKPAELKPAPTAEAKPAAAQPPAAVKRGGTLTVGLQGDFASFDPYFLAIANFQMIPNFYDTLIRYDHAIKPQPGLAEKWEPGADGTQLSLTLRKDAKFHSGKVVTAEDVVKNFDKARDKETGFNMFPATANVAEVSAKDANTVVVKFKRTSPEMLDIVQSLSIVDPAGFGSLKTRAAGTGPFKFVEYLPGDRTVAERNGDYWGKPAPPVDRVIFKTFTDNDAMVAALQSKAVDLAMPIPAKDLARLKADHNIVLGQPGSIVYELRINGTKPPLNNKMVRQGLHWAIDRRGIVDRVLYGASSPTAIPFDTFSPAYDPKYKDRFGFDLNKAKELLTAAGLKPTDTIDVLQVANVTESLEMAQVFQADLAKIGFKVNIETTDQAQYLPRVLAGDYMCLFSTSVNLAKYPSRIALNTVWRTAENPIWKNDVPKSYVSAIDEANSTLDPAKQKVGFGKLVDALLDESWVISIAWRQTLFGLQKHVQGFDFTVDDMMMLENVWLDR